LGAAAAAFGAAFSASRPVAQAQAAGGGTWQPNRHEQDDWLDKLSGKHRFVFDTTTPEGFGGALLFANNYFIANQNAYNLQNSELAVVIVARHQSTAFALTDSMWMKYGAAIGEQYNFSDPKTKQAPNSNLYNAPGYGRTLQNNGVTLDSMLSRGVQLAVCQIATRGLAGTIARANAGNTESIYNELVANMASNSHIVPAGIVAVNRAQERGYSFVRA
jgi:intracellular sulfur oxidation DsrE/DsrF family protein